MRGGWRSLLIVLLIAASEITPCCGEDGPARAEGDRAGTAFEATIAPLLTRRCVGCHAASDAKGKLDLSSRETLLKGGESGQSLVPGQSGQSLLWQRVLADEMPPKHPLTADEKLALKKWIEDGAVWLGGALDPLAVSSDHRAGRDWWSLQPLVRVAIPEVRSAGFGGWNEAGASRATPVSTTSAIPNSEFRTPHSPRSPIDSFVRAKLVERRLDPSPEADRRTLIRRLSFDLLGLPPGPEEVDAFVSDLAPDAFERLVDRLLASPHYGERWARHWLDVVRFGESNGFERDLPRPTAWHYRNWVIDALNRDVPYDEFVRWQLAGDVLATGDVEALKAVGFLVAGAHDTVVPVVDRMRAMMRQDELEDTVGTVSQTFLGLTVNCARCHDHKFDPISTREYYQIAAALSGVDHGEKDFIAPEATRQLKEMQTRMDSYTKLLRDQEAPIREAVLAERRAAYEVVKKGEAPSPPAPLTAKTGREEKTPAPTPLAAWDFSKDLKDLLGSMHAKLHGSAKLEAGGLLVDGTTAFASTVPLTRDLLEKTLEVRVRLKSLDQRGGGAISLQSTDGHTFDAIVFGEQEPRRWLAGSNGFVRTLSFEATDEAEADKQFVVLALVYRADGTITAYRNGQPYGKSIRKEVANKFEAGKSQLVFGLRHGTEAGGNRMLSGLIASARLYDKALSAEEVGISAGSANTFVTEAEIAAKLPVEERREREARLAELNDLRIKHADLAKNAPVKIYTAIATQPPPMKVHERGSVTSLGEEVAPSGLAAIQGIDPGFGLKPDAIESHRRVGLANWITNSKNPLFARVMANRVWHYHFGAGLVETPNDLGFHGGRPSHPELLEWLAGEFGIRNGEYETEAKTETASSNQRSAFRSSHFSLKRLHRQLVASSTYRQSSTFSADAANVDAGNRYLWRMTPRRLEAESVRDAMLVVAGQLNEELGGKGYSDTNSYFFKGTQFYDPIDPIGFPNQRRTIYRMSARGGRSPFLDTFDCPDPSTTTPKRSATVTPLQALSLMNHSFVLRTADQFASRLQSAAGPEVEPQVIAAYRLLYNRFPDRDESELSIAFVRRRGLPAFCRAMWNSSEFLFLD